MARLADLQRQIDEASEEVRHLAQDDQNQRPPRRELHQEGFYNEDDWYEDFHHGNFAFDNNSIVIYLGLNSLFLFKSVSSCWGPSTSEGPQKHDLTMFSK